MGLRLGWSAVLATPQAAAADHRREPSGLPAQTPAHGGKDPSGNDVGWLVVDGDDEVVQLRGLEDCVKFTGSREMPIPIGAGTVPRDDPGPEAGQRDGQPTHHDGYAERGFVARANRSNLDDAGDEEYLGPASWRFVATAARFFSSSSRLKRSSGGGGQALQRVEVDNRVPDSPVLEEGSDLVGGGRLARPDTSVDEQGPCGRGARAVM
jgi:hypothetical protein